MTTEQTNEDDIFKWLPPAFRGRAQLYPRDMCSLLNLKLGAIRQRYISGRLPQPLGKRPTFWSAQQIAEWLRDQNQLAQK